MTRNANIETDESTDDQRPDPTTIRRRSFLQTVSAAGTGFALAGAADGVSLAAAHASGHEQEPPVFYLFAEPLVLKEADLSPELQSVVEALASTGSVTVTGHQPITAGSGAPIAGEEYLELDGEYYRVTLQKGERATTRRYALRAEPIDSPSEAAVDLDEYTRPDRKAIKHAIRLADAADRRGLEGEDRVFVFEDAAPGDVRFVPDRTSESDLLPSPEHQSVTRGDATYELTVEIRDVTRPTYEYSLSAVDADATDDLWTHAPDVRLDPDGLTDAEVDVIETAIEQEFYRERAPYSQAYESVLSLFDPPLSGVDFEGQYFMTYDGERYVCGLWSITS